MSRKIILLTLVTVAFALGLFLGPRILNHGASGQEPAKPAERKVLYWVAPMDPSFRRDKPGKSPMGMDLVPVYEGEASQGDAVRIDPAVVDNLGVRTGKAKVRPLWRRIEATGYVAFDETRISDINTRVEGWIVSLPVSSEGERVAKGDLLFELYSPELVNAQKEYLQAYKRSEPRLLAGAADKLRALGMISPEIKALGQRGKAFENIKIVAPQEGVVTTLNVREGMYIQPNTTIMRLADLSSVWLLAEVFESQAEWVAAGQAAEARLEYMPGSEFSGQVDYVYPVLDPKTRTLRVRLRFDNPNERLKPNMYARVSIYGRLKPNALAIPREALIPAPGRDRVVVALGEGEFQVKEVLTGLESGDFVEILAGISEGDDVVTSAQFLIDSEASLAGSIQRLDSVQEPSAQRELGKVFASGRVEEVDPARRRVRILHGPIDALGWPGMDMVFDVKPGVDLGAIRAGQEVQFVLVQGRAGEYLLQQIHADDEDGATGTAGPDDSDETEESPAQDTPVMAGAVVRGIDKDTHVLRLEHDPIESLGWPSMTMNFAVDPGVDIDGLAVGQRIHFSMSRNAEGSWVIRQVHVMDDSAKNAEPDHD